MITFCSLSKVMYITDKVMNYYPIHHMMHIKMYVHYIENVIHPCKMLKSHFFNVTSIVNFAINIVKLP